jgi:hypothetical protein
MAVAYALINGMQLLQCVAPTPSERLCTVFSEAHDNLSAMDDHGRFEVSCLFYGSTDLIASFHRPHVAQLVVDGHVFELGKLPGGDTPAVVVSRFVPKYPKMFELRVLYSETSRLSHPDETLIVEEVRSIVSDQQARATKIASRASVHNRVKDLEVYSRVIAGPRSTSFKTVLSNHPDRVAVEPTANGQAWVVPAEEVGSFAAVHSDHDEFRKHQEDSIVNKLIDILRPGDLDFRTVFQQMATLPEFKTALTGSPAVLSRFLLTRPDVFWYRQDAQHTTRVGLSCNH